jgi:hypothetical protein
MTRKVVALRFWLLAAFCLAFLAAASSSRAQIEVDLQLPRTLFIRFEPIIATVSITNLSGQAIVLEDIDGQPWFSFTISMKDGTPIPPRASLSSKEPIRIGAGEMLRRQVNITPLYALDEFGTYKISATVIDPVTRRSYSSRPITIEMSEGRLIWQQIVGHPEEGTNRRISLLLHRLVNSTALYLRIEDPDRGRIFCTHRLGKFLSYKEPEVELDANNQVHVLHMHAPKSFTYSHIGLNGEILERKPFIQGTTAPKLTRDAKGAVTVTGGAVFDPTVPTAEEITPSISDRPVPLPSKDEPSSPPMPMPSPQKKQPLWPFGKKN